MPIDTHSPAPISQICRDHMKLTVTNVCSSSPEKPKPEVRQEISAKLYRIFKKYG